MAEFCGFILGIWHLPGSYKSDEKLQVCFLSVMYGVILHKCHCHTLSIYLKASWREMFIVVRCDFPKSTKSYYHETWHSNVVWGCNLWALSGLSVKTPRLLTGIGVGAQSTLGRRDIFAWKYMHEKLTKCPNFTWYVPENWAKNNKIHKFYVILSPKIFFSKVFGGKCPPPFSPPRLVGLS